MKQYYIKTYGCQMNQHDTGLISGIFESAGYRCSGSTDDADVIIFNTCTIREKAAHKVFSDLGRLKHAKKTRPSLVIAVGGCVGRQEGDRLKKRMPWVDIVFSPSDLKKPEELAGIFNLDLPVVPSLKDESSDSSWLYHKRGSGVSETVSIMNGCNNFCSYCVVPFTRGAEESRGSRDLINEITSLAGKGFREVVLLGQNVNSYKDLLPMDGREKIDFPDLLKMVNEIKGIERVRFVTSHPKDFSLKLVDAMSELSKVCEHIHLPLQSGSSKVLELMNRKYTLDTYMEKVEQLRKKIDKCTVSTDIIVGFPGETEQDFQMTLNAIRDIGFVNIYAFAYSKRPHTKALKMDGHMPEQVIMERLNQVINLQKELARKYNNSKIGTTVDLLVEGYGKKSIRLTGRGRSNQIVNFKGPDRLIGQIVPVKIIDATHSSLYGATIE